MKRTLLTFFAVFVASATAPSANAQITCDDDDPTTTVIVDSSNSYEITFCGSEVVDGNTTFKYNVREVEGKDLSHFTIELCSPLDVIGHSPEESDLTIEEWEIGPDNSTNGLYGIKWGLNDGEGDTEDFTEGMFSFTVAGVVGTEQVDVIFKTGSGGPPTTGPEPTGYAVGTTYGPNCEQEICLPGTEPTWNGDVTFEPAMAFINIEAQNGFHTVSLVEESSQNVVLLDVVGQSPTQLGDPIPTDFATGWNGLTLGDDENAPTSVQIKFGPKTEAGSTFMFRVLDQKGCELQVDPQIDMTMPETVELRGNYPNPFNPTTNIEFSVPEAMDVQLDVYDAMGRLVKSLVNDNLEAGVHNVSWNGKDAAGRQVASGAYFYRVQTGSLVQTKQMILLK